MMKFLYKKHKLLGNKGFSLVELIIVIAIMAVLMAVLAPQLIRYVERSRTQRDDTAASELLNAVNVALTNEAIYTTVTGTDTIIVDGATGNITINSPASADLTTEINAIVGGALHIDIVSNTRQAQDYTINIDVGADGVPTAAGAWA